MIQFVPDHLEIDVAVRSIRTLLKRAVYECSLDLVRTRLKRFPERLGQRNRLDNKTLQFREDRRMGICLIVFLIANALNGDESTTLQTRQLSFHRAGARLNGSHNLGHIETALGLAKD